jgi:hypothetical protein
MEKIKQRPDISHKVTPPVYIIPERPIERGNQTPKDDGILPTSVPCTRAE